MRLRVQHPQRMRLRGQRGDRDLRGEVLRLEGEASLALQRREDLEIGRGLFRRDLFAIGGELHRHIHAFVRGDHGLAVHCLEVRERERSHVEFSRRGGVLAHEIDDQRRHLRRRVLKAHMQPVALAPPVAQPRALDRLHLELRGQRQRRLEDVVALREELERGDEFDLPAVHLEDVIDARLAQRLRFHRAIAERPLARKRTHDAERRLRVPLKLDLPQARARLRRHLHAARREQRWPRFHPLRKRAEDSRRALDGERRQCALALHRAGEALLGGLVERQLQLLPRTIGRKFPRLEIRGVDVHELEIAIEEDGEAVLPSAGKRELDPRLGQLRRLRDRRRRMHRGRGRLRHARRRARRIQRDLHRIRRAERRRDDPRAVGHALDHAAAGRDLRRRARIRQRERHERRRSARHAEAPRLLLRAARQLEGDLDLMPSRLLHEHLRAVERRRHPVNLQRADIHAFERQRHLHP